MIKIEHTEVFGWDASIRGMRNPLESWHLSDSYWTHIEDAETGQVAKFEFFLGDADLKLMQNLAKAGNDHAKYLRMINVTMDVTAPLYWWKEADTYGVGVTKNSCSTMHKIHAKEFTLDDFNHEHLISDWIGDNVESFAFDGIGNPISPMDVLNIITHSLNANREAFLKTKDKKYWWQMIQLLPSSYNQKRTIQLNYAVLWNMYKARKNHKLDEWHDFCEWCESLPYFKEILFNG